MKNNSELWKMKKKKNRTGSFGNGILFFVQLNNWAADDDDDDDDDKSLMTYVSCIHIPFKWASRPLAGVLKEVENDQEIFGAQHLLTNVLLKVDNFS